MDYKNVYGLKERSYRDGIISLLTFGVCRGFHFSAPKREEVPETLDKDMQKMICDNNRVTRRRRVLYGDPRPVLEKSSKRDSQTKL
jgi:hypothetical protein